MAAAQMTPPVDHVIYRLRADGQIALYALRQGQCVCNHVYADHQAAYDRAQTLLGDTEGGRVAARAEIQF